MSDKSDSLNKLQDPFFDEDGDVEDDNLVLEPKRSLKPFPSDEPAITSGMFICKIIDHIRA